MFITLTHAMSNTPTQKPSIVYMVPRSGRGVNESISRCTWPVLNCLFVSGWSLASRWANAVNSALAWSSETPGLSVPRTAGLMFAGSLRGRGGNSLKSGSHSSSLTGKAKPWGMTPMIVAGLPLMRTFLPTMSWDPPKSRCQMP